MAVAEREVWIPNSCLRTAGEAIRGLTDLLLKIPSEVQRRRLLFWLRHLSYELVAEFEENQEAETTFDLLGAIDATLRGVVVSAGRPDLVLALVADDPLPGVVVSHPVRLLRLITGLLDSAIRTSDGSELLLEVTVLSEEAEQTQLCFLVSEDFTRIGSRTLAPLSRAVAVRTGGPPPLLTGVGTEAGDPASLWVSVLLRKAAVSVAQHGA